MEYVDVLIVGGGIAGASLAARLASERRVTIIEAEDICGRHATGRSAAFWQASLGGDSPERELSLASKPMFDTDWPASETPLLRHRGAVHLTGPCGEGFPDTGRLTGDHLPVRIGREELDRLIPGLAPQWTGAWYEASCADIDVAAFHQACLARAKHLSAEVRIDAALKSAKRQGGRWIVRTSAGDFAAKILVNAAGAWGDKVAERLEVVPLGLIPMRRTVVQLRIGKSGLKETPFVTDSHESFYFKGESDSSVWVCPLDETPVEPCDTAPEEIDVAVAIDRFERAVEWKVEAVERKWAGLRTFAPDRAMKFGFDPDADGFFWCVGQGGMGIQTAPAASLLCAALILDQPLPDELAGIRTEDFAPRSKRA